MTVMTRMGGALFLSAAMLAGCGGNKDNNTGTSGDTAAPAGTVGQAGASGGAGTAEQAAGAGGMATPADSAGGANGTAMLSDAEIISLTQASDEGEIATSQVAVKKATNADVRRYAQEMIRVHTRMISQRNGQLKASGAKPAAGAKDSSTAMAEKMLAMLNQAPKGAAFDTAYVNGQVLSHTNTLAMVQKAQNQAKDPALKTMLAGATPEIQKHLDEAKSLQGKLAGGAR
jgi:putative membrane protein